MHATTNHTDDHDNDALGAVTLYCHDCQTPYVTTHPYRILAVVEAANDGWRHAGPAGAMNLVCYACRCTHEGHLWRRLDTEKPAIMRWLTRGRHTIRIYCHRCGALDEQVVSR